MHLHWVGWQVSVTLRGRVIEEVRRARNVSLTWNLLRSNESWHLPQEIRQQRWRFHGMGRFTHRIRLASPKDAGNTWTLCWGVGAKSVPVVAAVIYLIVSTIVFFQLGSG